MDRINKLALRILAEQVLEADGKDIKSFDMTREEWKRYKSKHPGADIHNHHIIDSPTKKPNHMDKKEFDKYLVRQVESKKKYFEKLKKEHPNYEPIMDKNVFQNILYNGEYSCISAGINGDDPEDVKKAKRDPFFIKRRTEELRRDLDKLGVQYTEIAGSYGKEEPSFLISHTLNGKISQTKDDNTFLVAGNNFNNKNLVRELNKLGEKYNQNSVAHVKKGKMEVHYTTGENKGKRVLGINTQTLNPKKTKDFYSEARVGDEDFTMWTCNVDWDNLYDNPYKV